MPATQSHDPPRMTIRLDMGGTVRLGPGKIRLLELIAEHGSISAAGRAMGMSYKRAWTLVDTLNANFKEPLVLARSGGRGVGGAALSPLGAEVIGLYRGIEEKSRQVTETLLKRLVDMVHKEAVLF